MQTVLQLTVKLLLCVAAAARSIFRTNGRTGVVYLIHRTAMHESKSSCILLDGGRCIGMCVDQMLNKFMVIMPFLCNLKTMAIRMIFFYPACILCQTVGIAVDRVIGMQQIAGHALASCCNIACAFAMLADTLTETG